MIQIKANLAKSNRLEMLDNEQYLVSPVVLLVEGVHSGNLGPTYYTNEDLAKYANAWNGIPVVTPEHPKKDNKAISANSPEIIQASSIGRIFNTKYVEIEGHGRLESEVWTNINKAKNIAPGTLSLLQALAPVEVSTGLYSDDEKVSGQWGNEEYKVIARNYVPDHLAILMNEEGACSQTDGCGIRSNNKKEEANMSEKTNVPEVKDQKKRIDALIANEATSYNEECREYLMGLNENQLSPIEAMLNTLIENKVTIDELKSNAEKKEKKPVEIIKTPAPITNANESIDTVESYIAKAPPQIQEVLTNGMTLVQNQRLAMINKIKTNKRNTFTDEYLNTMSMDMLSGLATLAEPETDYLGQGGVKMMVNKQMKTVPDPPKIWDLQ